MKFLDFTTFMYQKLQGPVAFIAPFTIFLYILFCAVVLDTSFSEETRTIVSNNAPLVLYIGGLISLFCFIPTYDDLFNMRLSKLKSEAINDDNVKAGVDKITDLIDKLEQKYLGESK